MKPDLLTVFFADGTSMYLDRIDVIAFIAMVIPDLYIILFAGSHK
jgi:hypothetical protein